MPRPRGRSKTARISVNFDPDVYGTLILLAKRQDVPVAQIIRHAVQHLISSSKKTIRDNRYCKPTMRTLAEDRACAIHAVARDA
jgi:hypothetical protein